MKTRLVSVVIPVFNTPAEYLDACLESALGQTYRNCEIILVDDGSTDDSLTRCRDWERRDARIRVFAREHKGAGAARNFGMAQCSGEYLMFLDADDWWDSDLMEAAVTAIEPHPNVDFVFFDMTLNWSSGTATTTKIPVVLDAPASLLDMPLMLTASGGSACNKLYRTAFLQRIAFQFPERPRDEDTVILPWLYAQADAVFRVRHTGYHYRRYDDKRPAPVADPDNNAPKAEHFLMDAKRNLEKRTQYDRFAAIFARWFFFAAKERETRLAYARNIGKLSDAQYEELLAKCLSVVRAVSPPDGMLIENNRFLAFGSYSIRSVINYCLLDLRRVRHYQFSSLAAAFSHRSVEPRGYEHGSRYRDAMLRLERSGDFASRISDTDDDIDFVCLDLLEERFPLLDCGEKGILTKSDALDECAPSLAQTFGAKIMERGQAETETLWQKHCLEAIERLKARFKADRIILLKTYLAESYGEYGPEKLFDNRAKIRKANEVVKGCYAFFEKHFPGIHVIDIPEKLLFSDASFKHGCAPWHLSDFCYYPLAEQVREHIKRVRRQGHSS